WRDTRKANLRADRRGWTRPWYYEQTLEQRRLQEERVAIRARLKREYQLELNNPIGRGWCKTRRWNDGCSHAITTFCPTPD
ncbi:unnamed protein product, partial [Staurois parvus]